MATAFKNVRQAGVPIVSLAQAMAMIQDADLFFACGSAPAAVTIHLVTGSPISHTGFLWRDNTGYIRTVESTFEEGVHLGDGEGYLKNSDGPLIIARLLDITPADANKILSDAKNLIGRHYEVAEEIGMALKAILPFMRVKPDWKDLFCSGLVEEVLSDTKWPIPLDKSGGNATPIDVYTQPFVIPVCAIVR